MDESYQRILDYLKKQSVIDLSMYDQTFFVQTLQKRIAETNCEKNNDYFELLQNNQVELHVLNHLFQVNYTEFFRNDLTFSVLHKIILTEIIENFKSDISYEIRIWCAACSDGQEAYSIAMLLEEHLKNRPIKYRIFATDQSESYIKFAQNGIYHTSQMGQLTMNRIDTWFDKHGDYFQVKNDLKKHIDFSVFDLLNTQYSSPPASIFGNFDIVICANILYYYSPVFRHTIIKKITSSIAKNGYFITSETERELLKLFKLKERVPPSAIFQKK